MTSGSFKTLHALLSAGLLATAPLWAVATPIIYNASVNSAGTQVTISGRNFSPTNNIPGVTLDDINLTVSTLAKLA